MFDAYLEFITDVLKEFPDESCKVEFFNTVSCFVATITKSSFF
jgi:hypothetical protein